MDTMSYVSDDLDLEMNKISMFPLVPMFGSFGEPSGGFDFMPWLSSDDDLGSLSYFPSVFTDEASYDYFPPLIGNMTSNAKTGSTTSSAPPPTNVASTLNYSVGDEFSDCLTSDADSESGAQLNYSTFNEAAATYFGCQTSSLVDANELSDFEVPSSVDAVTPPPPKRARLMAANSSPPTKPKVEKSSSKSKSTYAKSESSKPAESPTSDAYSSVSRGASRNIQLQTASRKPKTSRKGSSNIALTSPGLKTDLLTPENSRARQSHNFVEKQYRIRLNAQFERLLAALPADKHSVDEYNTEESGADSYDRRMSKAVVLDTAREWIKTLELDIEQLEAEREKLRESARSLGLLQAGSEDQLPWD